MKEKTEREGLLSEYLRERFTQLGKPQKDLAKLVGVSPAAISQFRSGATGAGNRLIDGSVRPLGFKSRTAMEQAALQWSIARGGGQKPERYPALEAVRGMARAQGFAEEFVGSWEVQLDANEHPDADLLWTMCKSDYARWRGKAVRAGGDASVGLDEVPKRPRKRG